MNFKGKDGGIYALQCEIFDAHAQAVKAAVEEACMDMQEGFLHQKKVILEAREKAVREARDNALEEAAGIADRYRMGINPRGEIDTAENIAGALRARKKGASHGNM